MSRSRPEARSRHTPRRPSREPVQREPAHTPARDLAPAPGWLRWTLPGMIALVTFIAFAPALGNEFVNWDDDQVLLDNEGFRGLGGEQLRWMFTSYWMGHYHPLTWLSFALDYVIWGIDDAFGYHLTNVILHALNAVLFYLLAVRLLALALGPRHADHGVALRASAALAALLFSLHPLRVESVAWVTERRDVLSVSFLIPCVMCYLQYALGRAHRWGWYVASVALLLLSLWSKAWGITLPAVLLVLDFYPLRRMRTAGTTAAAPAATRLVAEKLPFAALAAMIMVTAARAQSTALETMKSLAEYGLAQRVAQAFYGLAFYVWKTVLPIGLAPLYEIPPALNPFAPRFVIAAVVVLAGAGAVLVFRRRWPAGPALLAIYVIILSPVLGFAQSGPQLVADRYSYVACMPLALLAGAGVYWCVRFWSGRRRVALGLLGGASAAVIVTLAVLTWQQTQVWRTSRTLWEHALSVCPHSPYAHYNLGVDFANHREFERAIEEFNATLRLKPRHAAALGSLGRARDELGQTEEAIACYTQALRIRANMPDIHRWFGIALEKAGRKDEAARHFRAAARYDPHSPKSDRDIGLELARHGNIEAALPYLIEAVKADPASADLQYNLGLALAKVNRIADATPHLTESVRLAPDNFDARCSLAAALALQGATERACEHYAAALRLNPESAEAHGRLADLLVAQGQIADAVGHYDAAVQTAPDRVDLANKLAWLLATSADPRVRNVPEAVRLAEQACRATGFSEPMILNTLATAYAEGGRFDEAVQALNKAIAVATAAQNQAQVNEFSRRLATYEAERAAGPGE